MNNPIVKLAIVAVLLIGGGWFGVSAWRKKTAEYEHRLDLERLRKEYLERSTLPRLLADSNKAAFEQQQVFKWYFNELAEHYNKFQGLKDYDRFGQELEEKKKAHKIKDQEWAQYDERYKATKALFELMKNNKYNPVWSANDQGLRFDVYEVQTQADPKEPKLRLAFALYGTQRKWAVDSSAGSKVMHLNVSASFHDMVFSGLDADGKAIREMRASGEPYKIDNPERFVDEFPPGVVFGYYDLPKIPAEVATAELTWEISTRSTLSGEEVVAKFVWKQPVPLEWKLPAGAGWEGAQEQVRENPDDAAAPTPAKGPAKKGKK